MIHVTHRRSDSWPTWPIHSISVPFWLILYFTIRSSICKNLVYHCHEIKSFLEYTNIYIQTQQKQFRLSLMTLHSVEVLWYSKPYYYGTKMCLSLSDEDARITKTRIATLDNNYDWKYERNMKLLTLRRTTYLL